MDRQAQGCGPSRNRTVARANQHRRAGNRGSRASLARVPVGPQGTVQLVSLSSSPVPPMPVLSRPSRAGPSDGYALPLTGLSASTTILKAGQFMTVPLPSGARSRRLSDFRSCLSDGSGNATAAFVPALGEIPTLAATVETKDPFLPLSLVNPEQGFGYDGGVAGNKLRCGGSPVSLPDATAIAALSSRGHQAGILRLPRHQRRAGTLQYQRRGRHPVWHGRSGP
jgi:hypothetical protein